MNSTANWLIRFSLIAGLVGGGALVAEPPGPGGAIKVSRTIPFAASARVGPEVREQCQLQTKVPEFLRQSAGGGVELVDGVLDRSAGRVLELEITEVHAPGGGAFSGPKWMTVEGKLYDRGKLSGSFRAKRFTSGGAFGAVKGTCSIIGRCTKAIGQDIAAWLVSPTENAELGDAR